MLFDCLVVGSIRCAVFVLNYVCYALSCVCFFFFKQKTAYEMRISDCSSDVCSSDLFHLGPRFPQRLSGFPGDQIGESLQPGARNVDEPPRRLRSEEHTSELQSLMRISYAVF